MLNNTKFQKSWFSMSFEKKKKKKKNTSGIVFFQFLKHADDPDVASV